MGEFQSSIGFEQAHGMPGDFADHNPRWAVNAGPGGLIAGANGATVGRFAWIISLGIDTDGAPAIANNFGAGRVAGFLAREDQATISTWGARASNVIRAGNGVTLFSGGSFWVQNDGPGEALIGMKAFASYADGKVSFAASGAPPAASVTASIAPGTPATFTGSIMDDVLTTAGPVSNTIYAGAVLSGASVITGSTIIGQISGAPGGAGTYRVSIPGQIVSPTSMSVSFGVMTVSAVTSGAANSGEVASGSGIAAGTLLGPQISGGTGAAGTYVVSPSQTATSTTVNLASAVETSFECASPGFPGGPCKMTTHRIFN